MRVLMTNYTSTSLRSVEALRLDTGPRYSAGVVLRLTGPDDEADSMAWVVLG